MQVTIDIEPGTYSLLRKVQEKGVSLDKVLRDALDSLDRSENLQEALSPDEWVESLRNWASEERNLPPVPDEASRRENIYEDRIRKGIPPESAEGNALGYCEKIGFDLGRDKNRDFPHHQKRI